MQCNPFRGARSVPPSSLPLPSSRPRLLNPLPRFPAPLIASFAPFRPATLARSDPPHARPPVPPSRLRPPCLPACLPPSFPEPTPSLQPARPPPIPRCFLPSPPVFPSLCHPDRGLRPRGWPQCRIRAGWRSWRRRPRPRCGGRRRRRRWEAGSGALRRRQVLGAQHRAAGLTRMQ